MQDATPKFVSRRDICCVSERHVWHKNCSMETQNSAIPALFGDESPFIVSEVAKIVTKTFGKTSLVMVFRCTDIYVF